MAQDTIVEEIHRVREEYAARFGNDLAAICKDAQKRQGRDGRKVAPVMPKPVAIQPRDVSAA
jgi:hypothetical protein